ncbi:tetratricopeptide repeat-containing sensor histidine kinase [Mucilaginibacter daejeonensis]|uniref:ATP-binding protein n=1 Tax=Mucilaginibacter daejeonensis TaxID=398049 RepID=UPI001D1712B3|nr:ATP-binding protein [Mucilaginibacter daejeonensis]UEG55118.1 tetratricopeptide repeat-containing sensor histidine kinase [Mucilaginibacter daejeonensis]
MIISLAITGLLLSCNVSPEGSAADQANYNVLIDSAEHFYDKEQFQKAVTYADRALKDTDRLSYDQKKRLYTLHYNYCFTVMHNQLKAIHYANQLIDLANTAPDQEEKAKLRSAACFFKGDALFNVGQYDQAYYYFYQGKLAAASCKDMKTCMLSDFSYHMGMVLYKQGNYAAAADNFKKSFSESATCPDLPRTFYRRQELLSNIGISYYKCDRRDSALRYMDMALTMINEPSKSFKPSEAFLNSARGVVYGNQASVYLKKGEYDMAERLLKKSMAINLQKGYDNNDAFVTALKLVRIYKIRQQPDSMYLVLNQIGPLIGQIQNKEAEADWNQLMADYYEQKDQLANSIRYLKVHDSINAIVNTTNLKLKANDINGQLRTFEKEYEVNALKKNNHQKSLYLTVAIVVFGMSLIILLLIYQNWQNSKKTLATLKRLNEQIRVQNTDLENSHQEKDRILRTVAHDLRNPIGGIASLTRAVIEDDDCSDDQKVSLELVRNTANNTLELINEIMEATNVVNDEPKMQLVNINDLVKNSVDLLRFKAAEKNQRIEMHLLEEPFELLISREKIWRVVSNLISNAIKFSAVGDTIQVELVRNGDCVKIAVIDKGIGIPENLKASVFNMFTDAKRPGTVGERSFGLGLSICRQIVDQHNGNIWFDSDGKSGTTFFVELFGQPAPIV